MKIDFRKGLHIGKIYAKEYQPNEVFQVVNHKGHRRNLTKNELARFLLTLSSSMLEAEG